MRRNKKIVLAATFLTMLIILSRFLSIKTAVVKISFGFAPTMLCATYLGWKWTVSVNVIGDLIGALLFPTGPFFIGYTLSTAVAGLIYGLLLYQTPSHQQMSWRRIARVACAVILVAIIVNMGLNTIWVAMTSGAAFLPLLGVRIFKQLIMIPVHIIIFAGLEKLLTNPARKYLFDEADYDQRA